MGVLTRHNRQEGLSRITAARIERFLTGRSAEQYLLPALLDFEQLGQLVEVPTAAPEQESPYLEQIIELVPVGGLLDRDSEMAELEAFCHGDETYDVAGRPVGRQDSFDGFFCTAPSVWLRCRVVFRFRSNHGPERQCGLC